MIAQDLWLWGTIAALAFLGSLAVSGFMSLAGLGDTSDGRSAHTGVIPTSGGVGIIAGLGLSLCALCFIFPELNLPQGFAPVMALLFAIGMLGLVDDALTLGPKVKFALMILISGAAVWLIGPPESLPFLGRPVSLPPAIGFVGAMLWIFVVMNAVNFMDGANGMMVLSLAIANFALFGIGLMSGFAVTLLLAGLSLMVILGFLPYNVRRTARVFAGDVGSLSLSFLFAISVLFLIKDTPDASYHLVGPILILPILTDVLLTLVRRARNRENLLQSHNSHLYQRLTQQGFGHLTVSWYYVLAALLFANIAVVGASRGWFETLHMFLILVGVLVAAYVMISRALADGPLADASDHKSSEFL